MDEAKMALELLNAIVDCAISIDYDDCITEIEYNYGMEIDDAFNILDRLIKEE